MFDDPPGCWLHRQASFINAFFPEDAEAGVDYDWFPLPPIDQEGTCSRASSPSSVQRRARRCVDFLERFIRPERAVRDGRWSQLVAASRPNVNVGPDCYANDILADASVVLTDALEEGTGRFDASDLMPRRSGAAASGPA